MKAQPRASKNEVAGVLGAELKVRVTAPPVDSAANEALVEMFADLIGVSKGSVSLAKGASSRRKQLLIRNCSTARVLQAIVV